MRDQRQIWKDVGFSPVDKRASSSSLISSGYRQRSLDRTHSSPNVSLTMTPTIAKRNVGPRHHSSGHAHVTATSKAFSNVGGEEHREHKYPGKGKGRADCRVDSIQPKPAVNPCVPELSTVANEDEDVAWLKEMLDSSDFLSVADEDFLSALDVAEDLKHSAYASEAKHDVDLGILPPDVARFLSLSDDEGSACASSSSPNQSSSRHECDKLAAITPAIDTASIKTNQTCNIPPRRHRRQFSHDAPLGSRPQDRNLRAVLEDTNKSCDSSSASHTTTHHDTYASSTDQSGTASTAPTIADSEGGSSSKVVTEDTENGSEIEV